jgi:hypothetical protein
MFDLGLAIVPGQFRWVFARPVFSPRALFCVLVAMPALACSLPDCWISRARRKSGSC